MKKIPPPFYSNTKDNTHCFQAVIKMIAETYWPDESYSWDELDVLTQKKVGMWTWPMAGYVWLAGKDIRFVCSSIKQLKKNMSLVKIILDRLEFLRRFQFDQYHFVLSRYAVGHWL